MAWQRSTLQYDAQLAYFTRYNSVNFKPDTLGDIVFNGVASNVFRGAFVNGVQGDAAYRLNELHTLRAGFISSGETTNVNSTNGVLGMDPDTGDTSTNPFTIIDPVSKVGWIAGFYLQDEWKLTDQLTLNYGFRFDQMWQFVNTNQLSPRVNLGLHAVGRDARSMRATPAISRRRCRRSPARPTPWRSSTRPISPRCCRTARYCRSDRTCSTSVRHSSSAVF